MSFGFITWFFIGLAIYLLGLLVWSIIKFFLNKKKVKKEDEEWKDEVNDNEDKKQ